MNPNKITTTVGLNIGQIDLQGVRLSFWDLGGQEELQSLWDKVCNNKISAKLKLLLFFVHDLIQFSLKIKPYFSIIKNPML